MKAGRRDVRGNEFSSYHRPSPASVEIVAIVVRKPYRPGRRAGAYRLLIRRLNSRRGAPKLSSSPISTLYAST